MANKESNRPMRVLIAIILLAGMILFTILAIAAYRKEVKEAQLDIAPDKALEMMADAQELRVTGDYDRTLVKAGIYDGDVLLGRYEEQGILVSEVYITSSGEKMMTLDYTSEDVNTAMRLGSTYLSKNNDGVIMSYLEESHASINDMIGREQVWMFYDADKNWTGYLMYGDSDYNVYDRNGNIALEVSYELSGFSYEITLRRPPDSEIELDDELLVLEAVFARISKDTETE